MRDSSLLRKEKPTRPQTTLHFEDHGQDFTEWDVDENGIVTDCRPFQYHVWVGVSNVQVDDNGVVRGISKTGKLLVMRYRAGVQVRL